MKAAAAFLLAAALLAGAALGARAAGGADAFCSPDDGWLALTLDEALEEVVNATTNYLPTIYSIEGAAYERCAGAPTAVAADGCQRAAQLRSGPGSSLWLVANLTCAGDGVAGLPPAAQELRVNVTADGELAGATTVRIWLSPDGVQQVEVPPEKWL